jgi:hypothetical protein
MARPKAAHARPPWPFLRKPCKACKKIHYTRETSRACALQFASNTIQQIERRRALKAWDALLIDHGGEG